MTFGLTTEYSVVVLSAAVGGQRQVPSTEAVGRRLFGTVASSGVGSGVLLRNGGRLHINVTGHPAYTTPDCGSVLDLIVYDKAGERILEGLLADACQGLPSGGDVCLVKANADAADSSSGCQESYLVGWHGGFGRLADVLVPFLVTRQLICGAGSVVQTPRGAVYGLSRPHQRAAGGLPTAVARRTPLISTRDEPRAAAAGLRRLRVMVSEPAMSETTMLLKAGATDLVLRMAEAGTVLPDLTLDKPARAIDEVSLDVTGQAMLRLADGRTMSALDIQHSYLTWAKDFTDARGADAVSARVLELWERALTAIETGNLAAIAREIDWVIKYQLIERYRARHNLPLSAPQVAQADLAYHDIDRSSGLYYELQHSDAVDRTARDIAIFEAKTVPPAPGRYRQAG